MQNLTSLPGYILHQLCLADILRQACQIWAKIGTKLAPNVENPGFFSSTDISTFSLADRDLYKSHKFVPFRANLIHFKPESDMGESEKIMQI